MRDRTLIRAVVLCVFATSTAAHSFSSAGDGQRFRREDVPLPPGTVSAIPIGGSEAGDIVGLAWDEAGNSSVWLRLADSGFGIPAGWTLLGSRASQVLEAEVAFSPSGEFVANSSFETIGISHAVMATAVGSDWHRARSFSRSDAALDVRAVADDGIAIGELQAVNASSSAYPVWSDPSGILAIQPPSPECMKLVPLSATTLRRAVAVANVGENRLPRAVLVSGVRAQYLDELVEGEFPWVSTIDRNGTIVAAVMREGGHIGICRLVDTGVDSNGDGAVRIDDFPIFLDRFVGASAKCDLSLNGEVDAADLFDWLDVAVDAPLPPTGARAWQLVANSQAVIPVESWPWQIITAAQLQLGEMLDAELRLPDQQPHTDLCRAHVGALRPSCDVLWDSACESLAEDFYAQVFAGSGVISFYCGEAVCGIDPFCCGQWDARCDELAIVFCADAPPGYGCRFTQPWPYDPNAPVSTSWAYCGVIGGVSYDTRCFDQCCFEHDVCYSTCGTTGFIPTASGEDPFVACQTRMLACMNAACGDSLDDPARASQCGEYFSCMARAWGYWTAVRWGSNDAWCACCAQVTPGRCPPSTAPGGGNPTPAGGGSNPPEGDDGEQPGLLEPLRRWWRDLW